MKFIILFIMMFLTMGCGANRMYHVGDCVASGDYNIYKIIEVGKYEGAFKVMNTSGYTINWHALKGGFTLTDCFDSFDQKPRLLQ